VPATLALIDGVHIDTSESVTRILGPGVDLVLDRPSAQDLKTLRRLVLGRSSHSALTTRTIAHGGLAGLRRFYELLAELITRGWLIERVVDGTAAIVSAIPLTDDYSWNDGSNGDREGRLSRFAFMRRVGAQMVLESPTARAQIVLHDWRVLFLLWQLSRSRPRSRAGTPGAGLPRSVIRAVRGMLWSAGFLVTGNDGPDAGEPPKLFFWEFHDLLFHSRSRLGRHHNPYGATYPFEGRVPMPPVFRPRDRRTRIRLFRPDVTRLRRTDWTLTRALEARRSQRDHSDSPITRRELGEFLFRSAAVRSARPHDRYAASVRVYPSGGSVYSLELYIAVRLCAGLAPGLYHYVPERHALSRVSSLTVPVRSLLDSAGRAVRAAQPQLLILIAARFPRAAWKYSSISYSLVLKEVGALMQTMYLVATAMGLGACALGGGDSDLFAKAAGMDYYAEGSVGEFILGRLPRFAGARRLQPGRKL